MGQRGAVDRDGGIFQWLAHEFKNFAENFGLLVEKQQVIVSKWNSTATGEHAVIDESSVGAGLMRRAGAVPRDTSQGGFEHNVDELNLADLECFVNCA